MLECRMLTSSNYNNYDTRRMKINVLYLISRVSYSSIRNREERCINVSLIDRTLQ